MAFDFSTKVLEEKVYPYQADMVMDIVEDTYVAQRERMDSLDLYDFTRDRIKKYLGVNENFLLSTLSKIEIPISLILSSMEKRGIGLDREKLSKLRTDLKNEIEEKKGDI